MKRVYVAGAYSADSILTVLENMRRGIKYSRKLFQEGFAPFCPFLDFHFALIREQNEPILDINTYYNYSLAFLEICDAMYVCPHSDSSKEVHEEILFAKKHDIPIFYNIEVLKHCLR